MHSEASNSHFFEVKLEHFDGPIDLLLHLVKENALPIEKLSLATVADQYMKCVEEAQYLDLELAGEYLVIAATLLSIKSSVLLNKKPEMVADDQGNLIDPHEELLRKLREAAVYKESAEIFSKREMLGVHVFAADSSLDEVDDGPGTLMQHNAMLLAKAFKKLLAKAGNKELAYTVSFEKISIVERMMGILAILEKENKAVSFEKLIPELTSRSSVIASFVSLLELCKRQIILIEQNEVFDEIFVTLLTRNYKNISLSSEFDDVASEEDKKSANA